MKVLEICPYSSGGCGVWARVKQEALELIKKGYQVKIFSSNFDKGTDKIVPSREMLSSVEITRFPSKKIGGESFMKFNFLQEAIDYSPDIIIVHNYRHLHTTKALKLKKILNKQGKNCKIFLVTHAPFVEGNITRTKFQTVVVNFYDRIIGPATLNKFDKILAISRWEIPYLLACSAKKEKIYYLPNGTPEEFFKIKVKEAKENRILFLGRTAPKKKIETIIKAIPLIKTKNFFIEIVGPKEEEYKRKLDNLISSMHVGDKITFSNPIYNLDEKINKIDSSKIYVLASRVEGMPQGIVEAMARGRIVIGTDSIAIRDIIEDKKNGFLFEFNNAKDLAEKIDFILDKKNLKEIEQIKKNALESSKKYSWSLLIKELTNLF
jgi:glycosyltransferase involved in cell wall biosynthesis